MQSTKKKVFVSINELQHQKKRNYFLQALQCHTKNIMFFSICEIIQCKLNLHKKNFKNLLGV